MKRTAVVIVAMCAIFVVTDEVRALLERLVVETHLFLRDRGQTGLSSLEQTLGHLLAYLAAYGAAGAVIGWRIPSPRQALLVALALGAAAPLTTLLFEPISPFPSSHPSQVWVGALYWFNWYIPPAAALVGAILGVKLMSTRSAANAA